MTDTVPPWLATMRAISGTKEHAGGADNPAILAWRDEIARRYPEMAGYCAGYAHDAIPWCGLTVAYCMAVNGIRPVYGDTDAERFLWAGAWARFGKRLPRPIPGCVMVLTREGGGHVTLLEAIDGDDYLCRGGNQADAVNVARYHKSRLAAAVWPSDDGRPDDGSTSPVLRPPPSVLRQRMARTILDFEARRDANGNLAVYPLPAGDGGGSYEVAGINDRYHPREAAHLRELIRLGRHAEAETAAQDFIVRFTDAVQDWHSASPDARERADGASPDARERADGASPDARERADGDAGVEFFLRDCCFNRGCKGAARILQRAVGVDDDGEVGPLTRAAMAGVPGERLLLALHAAREQYERDVVHRDESSKFWRGLVNRWDKALAAARAFSAQAQREAPRPARPRPPAAPVRDIGFAAGVVAAIGAVAHVIDGHPLITALAVVAATLVVLAAWGTRRE